MKRYTKIKTNRRGEDVQKETCKMYENAHLEKRKKKEMWKCTLLGMWLAKYVPWQREYSLRQL